MMSLLVAVVLMSQKNSRQLMLLLMLLETLQLTTLATSVSIELKDQPPQIKPDYQTMVASEVGETARITCPVYGEDERKPLVTWFKEGSLVHIGWDRYRTTRSGMTLLIDNANEFDNGLYVCSASNGFGTRTIGIRLTVGADANYTTFGRDSSTAILLSGNSVVMSSSKDISAQFDDIDVRVEILASSIPVTTRDETQYDIIMTSLLCLGSVVVLTSLGGLVISTVHRRYRFRRDRHVIVPDSAIHHLLTGAADVTGDGYKRKEFYYPTMTMTSCSTLITQPQIQRQDDVSRSSVPDGNGAIAMATETTQPRCDHNRSAECADQQICKFMSNDQNVTERDGALTWPQAGAECDCSFYGSSMYYSSTENCASV